MITLGVIPIALAIIVIGLIYLLTQLKNIPILKDALGGFSIVLIVLILYNILTVTQVGYDLAGYELNNSVNTSILNVRSALGIHSSITAIIIWPLVMLFVGAAIICVVTNVNKWLKLR